MVVKYNMYFGIVLCFMATTVIALHVYLYSLNGKLGIGFYSAIIILFLGLGYIKGKYFIVTEQYLSVYNSWGFRVKQYKFNSISDIYEKDLKFYIKNNSGRIQRIRISKIMSDSADWNNFIRYLYRENLSQELHDI